MKLRLYTTALCVAVSLLATAQKTYVSQMEKLDRGLIAFNATSGGNFVSWRFLGTDVEETTTFDLLRDGKRVKSNLYVTSCTDTGGSSTASYQVVTKVNGEPVDTSAVVKAWGARYLTINLDRPATGSLGGTYEPNDCSVGDVDGDGQYEILVKWYPSNAKDNSQSGNTDNTLIDCYKLDGTKLWRIDLGPNIRSGAHYTQFMVYDFDGDGKAEMMCKTAPGSKDSKGTYVNQVATNSTILGTTNTTVFRNDRGAIYGGQEYLTVFNGLTGEAIHTTYYNPNRNMTYGGAADGSVNWGVGGKNDTGSYGNRGERYLAGVAYLGGPDENPSGIFCRGYYDYAFIWAVDFDGQQLKQRWLSANKNGSSYTVTTYNANGNGSSKTYSNMKATSGGGSGTMYQNGNHNMSIADVDGDGRDEIVWGSAACDDDGRVLYGTGLGHGDAIHLADHCPDRPGLEVFQIHESSPYGWDLHDACTGEIIHRATGSADNGRGIAGQFDSSVRGSLFWSSNDGSAREAVSGNVKSSNHGSSNFRIYWDDDLQDELLDGNKIDKWNGNGTSRLTSLYDIGPGTTCNGSKNTPNLQADIFGDWREEVILHNGSNQLAIYSTEKETKIRMATLMHDHTYRMGVAWQNTAYNQPPHVGIYLPDSIAPHLATKDVRNLQATVGEPFVFNSSTYYTKKGILTVGIDPDGTKTLYKAPEGFEGITFNDTTKVLTLTGTPQKAGVYKICYRLTSGNGLVKNDTITINAVNPTGIKTIDSQTVAQPAVIYDIKGRVMPQKSVATLPKGIYIVREGTRAKKVIIK